MPNNHHRFSPQSMAGARLRSALDLIERGRDGLVREIGTMNAMLSGNGTQDAHFSGTNGVTEAYGFESDTQARAGRDELLAGAAKIDSLGDGGNTVGIAAASALNQLFERLR